MISLRKPEGSRASFAAGGAVLAPLGAGADMILAVVLFAGVISWV